MFTGLTVIELANVLAGPTVGMFFAELGARVIKVENPLTRGDVTRNWKLPSEPKDRDISSYFSAVNWGKQSIALNLRPVSGRAVVLDLIRKADIFIANYKPGDAKKLALDYPTIRPLNPRIIYADITGFGDDDPRTAYDAVLQAETGFMSINGTPQSGPVKMPVGLIDLLAAHQLKEAILLALIRLLKTGQGSYVSTSLVKSGIASLANQGSNWLVGGVIPQRVGSEHPNIAPYGTCFQTRDQQEIVLAVGNDPQFRNLCEVLGQPELADQPRFATNLERVKQRDLLNSILASLIQQWDRDDLIAWLNLHNVPAGAILNLKEVFQQRAGQEMITEGKLANGQPIKGFHTIAFQTSFGANLKGLSPPPHLNQHETEILSQFLGYETAKIARLKAENVLLRR